MSTVHDGWTVLTVGNWVVAGYDSGDVGLCNMAVVTLTELGFSGLRVAEVVGLTPQYVSMLRARARQEGSAGLVRTRGRRPKLSAADVARARTWRAQGLSDVQIGRRLGVSDKTAARALTDLEAPAPAQPELDLVAGWVATGDITPHGAMDPAPEPVVTGESVASGAPDPVSVGQVGSGSARIATGCFPSRYAGAMLLHAFTDAVKATGVFGGAARRAPHHRFDDIALLAGQGVKTLT